MNKDSIIMMAYQVADQCGTALEFCERMSTAYAEVNDLEILRAINSINQCSEIEEMPGLANKLADLARERLAVDYSLRETLKAHRNSFQPPSSGAFSFHQALVKYGTR